MTVWPPFLRPQSPLPIFRNLRVAWLGLVIALPAGCAEREAADSPAPAPVTAAVADTGPVPTYRYEVVNVFPHDRQAFTQGLIFLKGILIESTGLNGRSSLRKVDIQTGSVRQQIRVPAQYFAEGMTVIGSRVYQLTWQSGVGFVYDLESFAKTAEFTYDGEGWGLTTDGESLIMSDGTNRIRFIDPETFEVTRSVSVFRNGLPLQNLNELEYVDGEIYANIWQSNSMARIDPATGSLLGLVDFSGLLAPTDYDAGTDVLNGIAYDAAASRLFVTGKNWPKLFEVRLLRK